MFFKALTMGLGNANAYNVKIDKNVVATLRPGEETEIELPPGSHTVVFKAARSMGVKSNKLTVNIDINKDYFIEEKDKSGKTTEMEERISDVAETPNTPNSVPLD